MSDKKIRIFLGGYVNLTNAQNLNCLAIANHLDKERFTVYTLTLFSGNIDYKPIKGVETFKCFNPHRISKYLGYLWGIFKCDVAYFPKREIYSWNSFWIKLLNKKSFATIEGILDDIGIKNAIEASGSYDKVLKSYRQYHKLYSITNYLNTYNREAHSIVSETKTLYLGTNIEAFLYEENHVRHLKNILMIGNELIRKGVYDYLEIAKQMPSLNFFIAGSGNGKIDVQQIIDDENYSNVTYLGTINRDELSNKLKNIDLHILPSRSEGFPKVTLETAASGVPSLLYSDYGANEWITNNHDGFVVDTLEQMIETITHLQENPELLQLNSKNAIALAKRFDWSILIKDWEEEILKLYNS